MVVTDLNGIDIFLEHDWLVKHNSEVNWDKNKYGLKNIWKNTEYSIRIFHLNQELEKLC